MELTEKPAAPERPRTGAPVTDGAEAFAPPLPAVERDWAPALRRSPELWQIARAVGGGPFHVVHPGTFAANLRAMIDALAAESVSGTVYYGKKANKAAAWLREAAVPGAGVDVASVPEFAAALGNGIRAEDIGVTGAAKSGGLLWLAARHGALVAVDAADELERVACAAADAGRSVDVLLRVRPPSAPESRFGMDTDSLQAAVRRCSELDGRVELRGFSFHLDGYAVEPRARLADTLVDLCIDARAAGHRADRISIGGGIAVSYVTEEDWAAYRHGARPEWFHAGRMPEKTYPYHQAPTGATMVTAILRTESRGRVLAERLRDNDIEILLEPGRALVDGAGFSVFPVQGFEPRPGHGVTTVAGLSMSLSEQWKGSEFLPDPILVQRDPSSDGPVRTFVGGASCMEYDVLTWRAVRLDAPPRAGDLLVYPNTAGYQMDKNESGFHQLPLPPKVVVDDDHRWHLDTEFPTQEVR
ncbi:alanine racemase [Tsukamurella sp. 8F]|uniref:alanine racemase n=1 Tax=unclassified Tsukamurella TaxID=2633480 RepID=UPI0023B97A74|nr:MULTISPECIES: alanine racemase [unclassified Tsukamurella]MDF0531937.1 alanine racemase [Tsukamurella sp. 8J]MDF0588012.1 alanine racemase [Tsukamurella sp. 8F]